MLIWTDILGLRPVFREMGRRMAAQGYVVLVPNPFYRARKAPVVDAAFDFSKPEDRAKVMPLAAALVVSIERVRAGVGFSLAAVALRRFGPDALSRIVTARQIRRLKVVETLALDPTRRIVLINLDGEERLVRAHEAVGQDRDRLWQRWIAAT